MRRGASSRALRAAPVLRLARHEMRRRRTAPLAWGLPLAMMSAFVVAVFPSIEGTDGIADLVESYPDALKEAFDVSAASFSSIEGYLSAEVFSLIAPLAACAFVIRAVTDALCGAEARGTLDVLLAAPVSRREVVAGAFLGAVAVLVEILVVFAVLTWAAGLVAGVDLAAGDVAAGTLALVPLAVVLGGVALVFAGLTSRGGRVAGATTGVLFAMYLVEVLGALAEPVGRLRPLSAFHHNGSAVVDGLDAAAAVGMLAVGLVLAAAGAVLLDRRDVG